MSDDKEIREDAENVTEELKRIREDERKFNTELNKYRGYDAQEELKRATSLSESDEDRRAAEQMKARSLVRADNKRANELLDADARRAETRRSERASALNENLAAAHEDRAAVLQPLIRGERIIRQLAIGLALLVLLAMSVVIGLAYDTSENVKDSQAALERNSAINKESLELLKSCVVPEDPGTCSEESAQRTSIVIAKLVCYNYQYDRAFIEAALEAAGLPPGKYPPPPEGCNEFLEQTPLPQAQGAPNP